MVLEQENTISVKTMTEAFALLAKLNDPQLGLDECEDIFLNGLNEIFDSEYAILLRTDPEGGKRAIRKTMIHNVKKAGRKEVDFSSGVLFKSYQDLSFINSDSINSNEVDARIDSPEGIALHSVVCAPMIYQSFLFGILAVGNSKLIPLDSPKQALFKHLVDSLASRIHYKEIIEDLETSNFDLEVSQKQLLHSRDVLRTLFDNIPESFYLINDKYEVEAVNQSRSERADLLPKQIVGQLCYKSLYHLNKPCPGCLVSTSFETKKPTLRMVHFLQKDQSNLEWEIQTYPVIAGEDQPHQMILLEQNITEKRRLEAELIQSEKLAAVGQLAAGVAHEINNPLTSIIANAQMLKSDLPKDQIELVQSAELIESAGIKATQVVRNLLGTVRKEEIEFEPIDLNESIQNALMLLSHLFLSKNISMVFTRGKDMPLIKASENHLQSVWVNLIMNSIEAIEGDKGEIQITSQFDGKSFLVKITDNGKGIPNEFIGQIFEPFFTTKRTQMGTGLGLSLVRRTIQIHKGQILVESEDGKGTTFTIVLPKDPNEAQN